MARVFSGAGESGVGYNPVHSGLSPAPQHCVHRRDTGKTRSPTKLQAAQSQFVAESYHNSTTTIPMHQEMVQELLCYSHSATTCCL